MSLLRWCAITKYSSSATVSLLLRRRASSSASDRGNLVEITYEDEYKLYSNGSQRTST